MVKMAEELTMEGSSIYTKTVIISATMTHPAGDGSSRRMKATGYVCVGGRGLAVLGGRGVGNTANRQVSTSGGNF